MVYVCCWRDYDGENIPTDALEVGNGSNTYIAQVYIHNCGLFIGTLHKGQNYVEVSAYGVKKPTENIKILCTDVGDAPPDNMWLTTTSATFHVDTIEKYPIVGGYDGINQGLMDIGRVQHGSSLVVGSLTSFSNDVYLYYAYGGRDYKATTFQVLVNLPQ